MGGRSAVSRRCRRRRETLSYASESNLFRVKNCRLFPGVNRYEDGSGPDPHDGEIQVRRTTASHPASISEVFCFLPRHSRDSEREDIRKALAVNLPMVNHAS